VVGNKIIGDSAPRVTKPGGQGLLFKHVEPENMQLGACMAVVRPRVVGIIASLLTIACGVFYRMPQLSPGLFETQTEGDGESGAANGERIYFTATNADGEWIRYSGGPGFGGMMMGSYLTCAACHGPEGRGGTHTMHMQVMYAPDIRYVALSGEAGEPGDQPADEHGGVHGEYSLDDFRLAVVEGEHRDGEPLNGDMPRWKLSDNDLADLFEFLKSLP